MMDRKYRSEDVVIASGAALSNAFELSAFTMLTVRMPAAWTAASLGFKVAGSETGTYLPLYNENGMLVQIDGPAASKGYAAPADVACGHWVKLWSQDGAGSDTNQDAERTIGLDMKG